MDTPQSNDNCSEQAAAVIIALESRRFVIIRPDETEKLYPGDPVGRPLGDLRPGDQVYYGGRQDTVRSLGTY